MATKSKSKMARRQPKPSQRPLYEGPRILRIAAVLAFSGWSKTQLDEKIAAKEFPAPIKLSDSGRAVGWIESELMEWLEARKAKRAGRAA
jgi:prophage regulatory protein